MKLLFLLPFLALSALAQTNEPVAVPITLIWDFDGPADPSTTFTLYTGENATTMAPIISGIPAKYVTVIVKPGVYNFAVKAVTIWGESGFSNIYTTPTTVDPRNLRATNGIPNKPDQPSKTFTFPPAPKK